MQAALTRDHAESLGADWHLQSDAVPNSGLAPFRYRGDIDMVDLLLEARANANLGYSTDGTSALMLSAQEVRVAL